MTRKTNHSKTKSSQAPCLHLLILAYAACVGIWLLGRYWTGDLFLPIRWANFAAHWILLATATLTFTTTFYRQWIPTGALIVALTLIANQTQTLPVFSQSEKIYTSHVSHINQKITVLSFNIGHFNQNLRAVADLIKRNPVDIICLQEVTNPAILIKQIREKNPDIHYSINASKRTGLVVISRLEIISANRLRGTLTRYKISLPTGTLTLWNTHIPRGIWSTKYQDKVLANLKRDVKQTAGPKIITGDFNLTPDNDALQQLATSQRNFRTGMVPPFTYPTPVRTAGALGPLVQIDHIIASKHFHTTALKRLKNYAGSDHYPLSVQLIFRGNAYTGLGKGRLTAAGEG